MTAALNWYRAMDGEELADLPPVKVPTLYVWSTDDAALWLLDRCLGAAIDAGLPAARSADPLIYIWLNSAVQPMVLRGVPS